MSIPVRYFAVCDTAADVPEKKVTIQDFSLSQGTTIDIVFKYTNVSNSPMIIVNDTDSVDIVYEGMMLTGPNPGNTYDSTGYLQANRLYTLVYDGECYQLTNKYFEYMPARSDRDGLMSSSDKLLLDQLYSNMPQMEDGIWQPQIEGLSGVIYNRGTFLRIDRLVICNFVVCLLGTTMLSGAPIRMVNLPYVVSEGRTFDIWPDTLPEVNKPGRCQLGECGLFVDYTELHDNLIMTLTSTGDNTSVNFFSRMKKAIVTGSTYISDVFEGYDLSENVQQISGRLCYLTE